MIHLQLRMTDLDTSAVSARMRRILRTTMVGLGFFIAGCDNPAVPPPGPSDVYGRLEDAQGVPVEFGRIRIGAAAVYTGTDGRFRMPDVAVPYDLVVEDPATFVFQGLTRFEPLIAVPRARFPRTHWAYVTGRVPWQPGDQTLVFLFGSQIASLTTNVHDATGVYLFRPTWTGPLTTRPVSLFFLKVGSGIAWRFDASATRSLQIAEGQRFIVDAEERDFRQVLPREVTVEVIRPPNISYVALSLSIPVGNGSDLALAGGFAPPGQLVTWEAPDVPDLPLEIVARGPWAPGSEQAEVRVAVPEDRPDVQVILRAPVSLVAPADSAEVSADAELEWTDPIPSGVYAVYLTVPGRGEVTFYTDRTQVSLLDLPFSDGLPPGVLCDWYVESLGAAATVQDLVDAPGVYALRRRAWTSSARRRFSTASAVVSSAPSFGEGHEQALSPTSSGRVQH